MPSEQPPTRVEEAARALDKVIWLTDDVPHEVLEPARELHEALIDEPDGPAPAQPQPRGEGDDLAARVIREAIRLRDSLDDLEMGDSPNLTGLMDALDDLSPTPTEQEDD